MFDDKKPKHPYNRPNFRERMDKQKETVIEGSKSFNKPALKNQIFEGFNVEIDRIYRGTGIYGWKAKMDRMS